MREINQLFLSVICSIGLGLVAPSLAHGALPVSISIAIPFPAIEVSDLDARDALNRPIHSAAVRDTFEQLWVRSLNRLVLGALTPSHVQFMSLLNARWDQFVAKLR